MSCCDKKDKCGYPIEAAPFAPGGCDPHPPCPPRPPRTPFKTGCPPSQYIGSRYVPIFADPIDWDKSKAYESLTIVIYNGESYTSRCNVGPGIDITNTTYWAKTGAYNAILEQYRTEVSDLSSQVTGFAKDNAEFREKIDGYDKDNAAMKETIADYTGKVDKLTERVTEAETDIDALQATTAQHTKDIADLKAKDADLQAQITSNDADIANINDHQTEQDSRMDGIDSVNRQQAEAIAKNASDIAAEISRASAAEVANGKLIARNAEELADHAEELADHEKRITALETDNITNKADIRANAAKNVAQDAEIAAAKDAAAHAQETADGAVAKNTEQDTKIKALETNKADKSALDNYVLKTTYNAGQAAQDAKIATAQKTADTAEGKSDANSATIGSWEANHPGKTISQAVTDMKNDLSSTNETVTNLQNTKANKTDLNNYVTNTTYTAGQKTQDDRITALENKPATDFRLSWDEFTEDPAGGIVGAFNGFGRNVSGTPQKLNVILTGALPVEDCPTLPGQSEEELNPYTFKEDRFSGYSIYVVYFTSGGIKKTENGLGPSAGSAGGGVYVSNGLYEMAIQGTSVGGVTDLGQIYGYAWFFGPGSSVTNATS